MTFFFFIHHNNKFKYNYWLVFNTNMSQPHEIDLLEKIRLENCLLIPPKRLEQAMN